MSQTETKRNYKARFILDTREVEAPVDTLVGQLKAAVSAVGGEAGEVENLGRQDFIRVTDRHHTGDYYINIDFAGPPDAPQNLQANLRLDKTVKRVFVENIG